MIDHEQYKLKIKLSSSTYYLIYHDMYRFGFLKSKDSKIANPNYFLNRILPIIYFYRKERDNLFKANLERKLLVE